MPPSLLVTDGLSILSHSVRNSKTTILENGYHEITLIITVINTSAIYIRYSPRMTYSTIFIGIAGVAGLSIAISAYQSWASTVISAKP